MVGPRNESPPFNVDVVEQFCQLLFLGGFHDGIVKSDKVIDIDADYLANCNRVGDVAYISMELPLAQSFMELLMNHALKPDCLPLIFFTSKSLLHGIESMFAPFPAATKAHFILGLNRKQLDTWFPIFSLTRVHFVFHCVEM
jgi:hypothetical protein